jgi:Dolichyl-phosphate-mannose-protein mannosyltransferase
VTSDKSSQFSLVTSHLSLLDGSMTTKERLIEILTVAAVLAVSAAAYTFLFNRSTVLSHSIGYNLYASERVLEGAVPYRDFHTLYPPATFYLNAALFRWSGVSLHSALLGVLIFKVLTVVVIYLSGRQLMPRVWALVAALSSLLWLRPNGPFKSVPMHYGALLLALAMCLLLKYENRQKLIFMFLAGVSLGLVALFKHNIGAYALAGSVVFLLFEDLVDVRQTSVGRGGPNEARRRLNDKLKFVGQLNYRRAVVLLIGCATVIVPALVYMQANGALAPMIRTLLFGPGEFLLSRLAIPLSPVAPALLVAVLAVSMYAAHKLRSRSPIAAGLLLILIAAISVFLSRGNQADVNQILFYLPMLVLASGLAIAIFHLGIAVAERRALLIVFIFSAAALMELFPRFAREQSVAAMPFVMLFLFYLLYVLRPATKALAAGTLQYRLALAVLPIAFVMIEGRLFFNTYFDSNLRFKAGTPISIERGRSVYFPAATAALIDNAVSYIQQRVPTGGNAFAQSDAGTSLLFLSNRRNISNAQFWIGVGVTQDERAATLERIDKSQTKLIITSDEVLAAEKYEPMRDYIDRNFKASARFDDVLILER